MPRLIDANALLKRLRISYLYHKVNPYIVNAPTVDAVEVVHGRWVRRIVDISAPYYWKDECSICHWEGANYYQYCPGCGAKMDGGNEDV